MKTFEHLKIIEKIKVELLAGKVEIDFLCDDFHTPTIIGYLLGYPVLYQIGRDINTKWLNNLPLMLYKLSMNNVVFSSFTVPTIFSEKIEILMQTYERNLDPSLILVKNEICLPDVNL